MRKLLPILAAMLALPGLAVAEPGPISGEVTVEYGWVKNADGKKVNIAGKKFPYTAYPVATKKLTPISQAKGDSGSKFRPMENPLKGFFNEIAKGSSKGPQDSADVVVYYSDGGSGYGYAEFNPSSLDDITMTSAGLNKPWSTMTFGMNHAPGSFSPFIIRWRCYKTNFDNPAPQTDFTEEFADFGVRWVQSFENGYIVEINVAQAAVSTDDASVFVAQQFREPRPTGQNEDGEGPFKFGTVDTIFNASFPPTTGSSADQFWYDWDPAPDGAYENTEIDVFEGSLANHVFGIKVAGSGSVTTLSAVDARKGIGTLVSGNLISVLSPGDNNEFKITQSFQVGRTSPVGSIEVDFLQTAPTITGIRLNGTAGVTLNGCDQWVDLYDFVNSTWVQFASMPAIPNGNNTFNESYGGLVPIGNFVGTVTHPFFGDIPVVRARLRYKNTTYQVPRGWQMKLDHLQCTVTTP